MMSLFIRVQQRSLTVVALTITACCFASVSRAQQYRTDPVDEGAKRLGIKAQSWVGNAAAYASDKANFINFFQKYYFPAMTRSTPSDLAELGKLRVDLFKKYLWATSNAELQEDLSDMALRAMWKIVSNQQAPQYHPSVRYNAVLVIGLVDSEYAVEGGPNPRPPKPHPTANKALMLILNKSMTDNQYPPPVVLGALIGLERHAKYHESLTPDAVKAMSAALLKFVNNDKPIQGMDADAYAWLRLRAASALVNLGSLGENNAVHDAIIKLIATSKSLDDRCSAAALLSSFKYENIKVDGTATTKSLFKLTSDLSAEELKRALEFEKNPASMSGSPQPFAQGNSDEPQDDGYPRRHVLARLVNLGAGLKAVKPALPEDSQKHVDAILAAFIPVVKATANADTGPFAIADAVRTMSGAISDIIGPPEGETEESEDFTAGGAAPAAAPAAAPSADPGATPATAPEAAPAADAPDAAAPPVEEPPAATPATPPAAPAPVEGAKE